jgi:hypothetical protein
VRERVRGSGTARRWPLTRGAGQHNDDARFNSV